jgi:hypothetical protein
MKNNILSILFVVLISLLNAQNAPFEIKKGTILKYGVEAGFDKYDFIVEITSTENGVAFDWKMTAPADISGKIKILPEALKNAVVYHNYFKGNTELTFTDKSSVFLSQKNVNELTNNEIASLPYTKLDLGDGLKDYYVDKRGNSILHLDINKKHAHLSQTIVYNTESLYEVNFIQIGDYYLISSMYTNFSILLKKVIQN